MKRIPYIYMIVTLLVLLAGSGVECRAQRFWEKKTKTTKQKKTVGSIPLESVTAAPRDSSNILEYIVEGGDTIYIEEIDKYGIEQLLALVAHGDIDYAVCDEGIAMASMKDFPQLDIDTPISFTQFNSWSVNKQSIVLLDTLNAWLDHYTKTKAFKKLRKKYYKY